jgi:hypothetical protein
MRNFGEIFQGAGSCPAREGEAGSLDKIEATVGRGRAKLFPLRADLKLSSASLLTDHAGLAVA